MASIVVIGGGWSGCAAALTASLTGGDSVYFERMKKLNLYQTDKDRIHKNIRNLGLNGVFRSLI